MHITQRYTIHHLGRLLWMGNSEWLWKQPKWSKYRLYTSPVMFCTSISTFEKLHRSAEGCSKTGDNISIIKTKTGNHFLVTDFCQMSETGLWRFFASGSLRLSKFVLFLPKNKQLYNCWNFIENHGFILCIKQCQHHFELSAKHHLSIFPIVPVCLLHNSVDVCNLLY